MTDRRFDVDGVPLDHPHGAWSVMQDGTSVGAGAARRVQRQDSAFRHGARPSRDVRAGVGKETLAMIVRDVDPQTGISAGFGQMWRNLADLRALLAPWGRVEPRLLGLVPEAVREPELRYVTRIEVSSAGGQVNEISPKRWVVPFTLDVIDAFWRDAEPIVVTQASASALRGGSAPIVDPLFMVPGQGDAMRVRIRDHVSGQWIAYDGDVPTNQYVRIDPNSETAYVVANAHAWTGGSEHAAGVTTGPGGFELQPAVEFSSTVPGVRLRAAKAYEW